MKNTLILLLALAIIAGGIHFFRDEFFSKQLVVDKIESAVTQPKPVVSPVDSINALTVETVIADLKRQPHAWTIRPITRGESEKNELLADRLIEYLDVTLWEDYITVGGTRIEYTGTQQQRVRKLVHDQYRKLIQNQAQSLLTNLKTNLRNDSSTSDLQKRKTQLLQWRRIYLGSVNTVNVGSD